VTAGFAEPLRAGCVAPRHQFRQTYDRLAIVHEACERHALTAAPAPNRRSKRAEEG